MSAGIRGFFLTSVEPASRCYCHETCLCPINKNKYIVFGGTQVAYCSRLMDKLKPELFDASTRLRVETVSEAARTQKADRASRKRLIVFGFWAFGSTDKRDALVDFACYAFRTSRFYCSNVAEQRFEGVACVNSAQLPLVEEMLDAVGMSAGMTTLGTTRYGGCAKCVNDMSPGFLTLLSRIEEGGDPVGRHPVYWGATLKDFIVTSRQKQAVVKTTGLTFDPNNMIMLFMSHRASQFSIIRLRTQLDNLRRVNSSNEATWTVISRENNRMLFEVQQAYSTGQVSAEVFERIAFGPSD